MALKISKFYNKPKNYLFKILYYYYKKGYKTSRKIIVIESDDWGAIRMPSKKAYNSLLKSGIDVDKSIYNKYDSLESKEDMSFLFELLYKVKDKNGNPAIFTANSLVANPDFERIKESGFQKYYYELLPDSLSRRTNNSINLWFEGMNADVFHPQFHGREHLNVNRWLKSLQNNSRESKIAFEYEALGITDYATKAGDSCAILPALAIDEENDINNHKAILQDGYHIFEQIFNYKSESFIAPNYVWQKEHEKCLSNLGVNYLQGTYVQKEAMKGDKTKIRYHFTGEENQFNQIYLVRNCFFEPASDPTKDWVSYCLKDIKKAFSFNKPAIICSHRVNYIGVIDERNRDKTLKAIKELLDNIIALWPDVEFMTSDQLGRLILQK